MVLLDGLIMIARQSGRTLTEIAEEIVTSFKNSQVVVSARENSKLIGVVRGITDKVDMGLVVGLAVNPAFRGQGIEESY